MINVDAVTPNRASDTTSAASHLPRRPLTLLDGGGAAVANGGAAGGEDGDEDEDDEQLSKYKKAMMHR